MVISLIEILELQVLVNFGLYNIIWITRWQNIVDHVAGYISEYVYFKDAWSSQFCWHYQTCHYAY